MNINSTSNSTDPYIQSLLNNASLANAGSTASTTPLGPQHDGSQLSPLGQLLSTLQQLQQQNPTQYQQVTAQIATNLQTAAASAQSSGNSSQAGELNQLASDFQTASQTGQLPNIQDLSQAAGAQHHHHHHHSGSQSNSGTDSSQNDPSNPFSIIESTLSGSGS